MPDYKLPRENLLKTAIADHKISFEEFTLQNGLHCIMHKDQSKPIVSVTTGYNVGSCDEKKGYYGVAHLFEHMMFQGSENVKKNEHFEHILKSGGSCNAFTMQDATVYFETLPSNSLETALWLESDRMNSLDINVENLDNQKSVVLEEKKQVFDNAPYGNMFSDIFASLFRNSGYEHPIIGYEKDILDFSVKDALEFHNLFYSPCNAVIVIAGDIDFSGVSGLVNKYFGGLRTMCEIPRIPNLVLPLEENSEKIVEDNVQLAALNICFQGPKAGMKDEYALEYFSDIIANTESSRLYKKLVYEEQLVRSIKVSNFPLSDAGALLFRAYVNPGADIDEVRDKILSEIEKFGEEGCTESEFEKVRNSLEFGAWAKHLKIQNIAVETVFNHLYYGDASRINEENERYLSVTREDIRESTLKYMVNSKHAVVKYMPKNGGAK